MATAAHLPIAADRVGACVRTIFFRGLDLTGVALAMQVRLAPDTPGDPLIDLALAAIDLEGLHLVGAVTTGGVPTSEVRLRIAEATMRDDAMVPYGGEIGSGTRLSYDLIGTFSGDKRRLAFGDFIALPTTYGSDDAPAERIGGGVAGARGTWNAATLTFSNDTVAVTIDGADMLAPIVARAEDAADTATEQAALATAAAAGLAPNANLARALAVQKSQASPAFLPRNYARQFAITTVLAGGATTTGSVITIPVGGSVTATVIHPKFKSDNKGGSGFTGDRFIAVYQKNPSVAGMTLALTSNFGANPALGVLTQSVSGLWQATVTGALAANTAGFKFVIGNAGAAPITIRNPFVGLAPYVLIDEAEVVAVRNRPWRSKPSFFSEQRIQDRQRRALLATYTVNSNDTVSLSNPVAGSDAAAGSVFAPFKTLAKLTTALGSAALAVLAFYSGSVFAESLNLSSGANNLQPALINNDLRGYGQALPNFDAGNAIANNAWTNNFDGTRSVTVAGTAGDLPADDGYSNVYPIEINFATIGTQPIGSRKRMDRADDLATLQATAGTFMVTDNGGGSWTLRIHPSDGAAPGTRYNYAWSARHNAVALFTGPAAAGWTAEGLQASSASSGAGSLNAGRNFHGSRLLITEGGTHHAVIQSGSLTDTIISGRGDDDSIQLVFYVNTASGSDVWEQRNVWLYGSNYDAFYSHTTTGSYLYGRAIGGGVIGEGTLATGYDGTGYQTSNQTNVEFDGQYVSRKGVAFSIAADQNGRVNRAIIQDCARAFMTGGTDGQLVFENSHARISGSYGRFGLYQAAPSITLFFNVYDNSKTPIVRRNFLHIRPDSPFASAQTIFGMGNAAYSRNIFVLDALPNTVSTTYCNISSASGYPTFSSDFNLIVYNGYWGDLFAAYPGAPNQSKYDDYLTDTGQDVHSPLMTADGDPDFLSKIFVDLLGGNQAFAPTALGKMAADYCIANDIGPPETLGRWLELPTVDEMAFAQRMLG